MGKLERGAVRAAYVHSLNKIILRQLLCSRKTNHIKNEKRALCQCPLPHRADGVRMMTGSPPGAWGGEFLILEMLV